jgi:hypothetical protein
MLALDVAAQSCGPDDLRSMDQRRADALVLNVTVALSTLLGYDEQAGEIDGGPVPNDLSTATSPAGYAFVGGGTPIFIGGGPP